MSSKNSQNNLENVRRGPKMPGGVPSRETSTVKLDEGTIDALIKGLAGTGGSKKESKKKSTDEDALKNLKDSIVTNLNNAKEDITYAITGTLIEKLQADKAVQEKAETLNQKDNKDYQTSVTLELAGMDPKKGLGLTNLLLSSIAQGVYYINDALFGYKKWKPDYTNVKTQTIQKFGDKSLLYAIVGEEGQKDEKTSKLTGKKTKDKGILGTEVDAFLSIVDALKQGLNKGKLKEVARDFNVEAVISILSSLKVFNEQLAEFDFGDANKVQGNPLGTLGQIFDSLQTIQNADFDEMLDSMDDLSEFIIGEEFAEKINKLSDELVKINDDLTKKGEEYTPDKINKNVSTFTDSINQLFDIFKDLKMKDFFTMKMKSILLTSGSTSLSGMINPLIEETVKVQEAITKNDKAVSEFGDNVKLLKMYVFDPLSEAADKIKLASVIQFSIVASTFNTLVVKPINNLLKALPELKSNTEAFRPVKNTFKALTILSNDLNKLAESADLKNAAKVAAYGKIGAIAYKNVGELVKNVEPVISVLLGDNLNNIEDASYKILELTDLTEYLVELTKKSAIMAMTAPLSALGFFFAKIAIKQVDVMLNAINGENFGDVQGATQKVTDLIDFTKSLSKVMLFGASMMITGLPALIGFFFAKLVINQIGETIKTICEGDFPDVTEAYTVIDDIANFTKSLAKVMLYGASMMITAIPALIGFILASIVIKIIAKTIRTICDADFPDVTEVNTKVDDLVTFTKSLAKVMLYGAGMMVAAIPALIGFILTNITIRIIKSIVMTLTAEEFPDVTEANAKLDELRDFSVALGKILASGASMAITAIPALIGFVVARIGVLTLNQLVIMAKKMNTEDLKVSKENMKSLGILVGVVGGMMIIGALTGAMVLAKFKELIGFVTVFAAFTMGVLGALNLASKGMSKSLKAGKEIAILIGSLAMLMMIASVTGGWVMKHIGSILGFALALGLFIFLVVGALNLATMGGGGLRHLEKSAKAIIMIVVASAAIMLLGGLIFMTQKKLIVFSLIFAIMLGTFVWALCKAVAFGAKAVKQNALGLILIMAFEIVTAAVLLFPSFLMMKYPNLKIELAIWVALNLAYIGGLVFIANRIKKSSKDFLMAMGGLALLGLFNVEMAASMYILVKAADQLAVSHDGTVWAGLGIIVCAGLMVAGEIGLIYLMKGIHKNDLIKGAATLAALGAINAELAGAMYLWVKVAQHLKANGGEEQLAEIAIIAGAFIGGEAYLVKMLAKFDKSKVIMGSLVLEALILMSGQMAGMMYLWLGLAKQTNGHKGEMALVMLIAAGCVSGVFGIVALLGSFAMGTLGIGAAAIAAGAAVLEGLILLSMQMAVMMRMWLGVAKETKELEDLDFSVVGGLFEAIADVAVNLVTTFKDINFLDLITTCGAVSTLGYTISTIAEGVAEAANMHYTKYENGKKIGEFNLTKEDFTKAAENTKQVVSILGQAILDIYAENPEIFEGGNDVAGFLGLNTKFSKVCNSVLNLGKVIAMISAGVASAANMHYTKYENGKEIGKFNLVKADFQKAAENTKQVVQVLGQAIIDIYEQNPEMFTFKSGDGWFNMGFDALANAFGAETPFAKTCRTVGALGNLISNIADGVIKMANGDIKYWDEQGNEKHRNITPIDYANAIMQTNMIIKCLGQAVIEAYNKNPELFSSGSVVGDLLGFNPKFKNIIDTISSLGTLIKNIADGIQTFASGAVPVYGDKGEVKTKRPITESDYINAAACITAIVSTMGQAVMDVYENHKDWFTDSSAWSYVVGDNPSNTPFAKTVACLANLSNLIGEYAKQVELFAKAQVPIYGPDGKEMGKIEMTEDTYRKAGECIGTVISTLVTSLNDTYKKNEDFFDEDNWEPLESSLSQLSKLLGKYASNIKDWAAMEINLYDDNGKALGKKTLTMEDIIGVGVTIETIILTMVTAIQRAYNGDNGKNKEIFNTINSKSKDTWFSIIVESTEKAGQLISKLAKGVKDYANMRIDNYDENGNKKGSRSFTDADFTNAGKHISMLLTALVSSISQTYNSGDNAKMFHDATNWGDTQADSNPFSVVARAGTQAGEMISACAKGFTAVANIPALTDEAKVKEVQGKTKNLLMALCKAVQETYFELDGDKMIGTSIFDDATKPNSIINRIAVTVNAIAKMVTGVVSTYQNLAKQDTSAMAAVCGTAADSSDNLIYKMIKGLAQPIIDILNPSNSAGGSVSVYALFSGDENTSLFTKIKNGVEGVSKMMRTVQSVYDSVSKIQVDFNGCGEKIRQMINGLANPIIDIAANDTSGVFGDPKGSWLNSAVNALGEIGMMFVNPLGTLALTAVKGFFGGGEEAPDTPFGRVVQGLGAELKIMGEMFKVYAQLNQVNIKQYVDSDGKIPVIGQMINGLVDPIVEYGQDSTKQSIFNDGLGALKDVMEDVGEVFLDEDEGIFAIYTGLSKLKFNENMPSLIKTLLQGIMEAISQSGVTEEIKAQKKLLEKVFDDIDDIFNDEDEGLFSIYENLQRRLVRNLGLTTGKGSVALLHTLMKGLSDCFVGNNVSGLNSVNVMDLVFRTSRITTVMDDIFEMYEAIPPMNKDIMYFIPLLTKLQNTVGDVPKIKEFEKEVKTLTKFNQTTNSLRIQNVKALQSLMIELNKFGSKFGNLDKFTEVLATKLSNCLTYLADQIKDSAEIVNKTGELNEARKKQIQDTIQQFRDLSEQGINVYVQQGGGDPNISAPGTGGNNGGATQTENNEQNNTPDSTRSRVGSEPAAKTTKFNAGGNPP